MIGPRDTTKEAARVQCTVLRRIGLLGRAQKTFELCEAMRKVLACGVRYRHPNYTADQVHWAVIRLTLGEKLFREAFPGKDVPG